jgi:hypothetical protein
VETVTRPLAQFAFRLKPVIPIVRVCAATLFVPFVRATGDLLVRRLVDASVERRRQVSGRAWDSLDVVHQFTIPPAATRIHRSTSSPIGRGFLVTRSTNADSRDAFASATTPSIWWMLYSAQDEAIAHLFSVLQVLRSARGSQLTSDTIKFHMMRLAHVAPVLIVLAGFACTPSDASASPTFS